MDPEARTSVEATYTRLVGAYGAQEVVRDRARHRAELQLAYGFEEEDPSCPP